ncbi:MAG: PilZ domain-containing protein [Candidatus Goldiibacteriota bacterium]
MLQKNSNNDKRQEQRREFSNNIKYKLIGAENTNYEFESASTRNISKGGICVVIPHRITQGNVVRVEIPMPDSETSIKAFCEVQWNRPADDKFETGMSFIALKEDDLDVLKRFLEEEKKQHAN